MKIILKITKIKLIIGQNENNKKNNRNKQPLEKRTIRRREKSEIINTEPVKINLNFGFNNQNKGKNKFKDTKNGFCMFIKKKNINPQNIRNIYFREKQDINIINNRIKTLDYNKNDNHPLSAANDALPKIKKFGKISSTIAANKEIEFKFKKRSDLNTNQKQKNKSISFLLDKDFHNNKTPFRNKKINMNNIIKLNKKPGKDLNINNYKIPMDRNIIQKVQKMNKKELKIELNKLKIITDSSSHNSGIYSNHNNLSNKLRPSSVKFKNNIEILRPLTSNRKVYSVKKEKNSSYSKRNRHYKSMSKNSVNSFNYNEHHFRINSDNRENEINNNNNQNIFYHPDVGGYKLFYNHYYQNFLNLKSNENQDKPGVNLYFNKINNNSKGEEENSGRRKIIYEKIKIEKKGEETKYNKENEEIKYVGMGNHYNRYNVVLSKYPNLLKINNDYGIQNLNDLNKNKNHKDGPMVILPNKMLN